MMAAKKMTANERLRQDRIPDLVDEGALFEELTLDIDRQALRHELEDAGDGGVAAVLSPGDEQRADGLRIALLAHESALSPSDPAVAEAHGTVPSLFVNRYVGGTWPVHRPRTSQAVENRLQEQVGDDTMPLVVEVIAVHVGNENDGREIAGILSSKGTVRMPRNNDTEKTWVNHPRVSRQTSLSAGLGRDAMILLAKLSAHSSVSLTLSSP